MKQLVHSQRSTPESDSLGSREWVRPGESKLGQLQWSGLFINWEILIYRQESFWEVCFFKWDSHHEHLKALSLEEARGKAEERIRLLERPKPTSPQAHLTLAVRRYDDVEQENEDLRKDFANRTDRRLDPHHKRREPPRGASTTLR